MITIPDEQIEAAIDRLIARALTPEQLERRIAERIDSRLHLLTIDDVAARWRLNPVVTARLLKKFRAERVHLSAKTVRYRVAEIERIEQERTFRERVRKISHAPFHIEAQAA